VSAPSLYRTEAGERALRAIYDANLAKWPVPRELVAVATRHGATSVLVSGPSGAPPLVLLHAAGANAIVFRHEVARFAARHRVFAVDVIGEPGRSAPVRPPWDGPAYTEWLTDVMDGLGLSLASLLGQSQGGWIALKLATAHPERVDRLVLVAPVGVVRDRASFVLGALLLLLLGRHGRRAIVRRVAAPQRLPAEVLSFMELVQAHVRPRTRPSPIFRDEELRRLEMPVCLIGGAEDALRDCRAIAARLGALLPRFEAHLVPRAGHVLIDFAGLALPFLDAPARASPSCSSAASDRAGGLPAGSKRSRSAPTTIALCGRDW
jgi:pimeloyl-ACP methyl ester carboxylesterase